MSRHTVPTHLDTPDGIDNWTIRQGVVLCGGVLVAAAVAVSLPPVGPSLFDMVRDTVPAIGEGTAAGALPLMPVVGAALVMIAALIVALPFEPPVEHGAVAFFHFRARPRMYAGADAYAFIGSPAVSTDVAHVHGQSVAMWSVPAVSLRLASDAAREAERARWAAFLDGIPCPIQTFVRATPVDLTDILGAMRKHANPAGLLTAQWLGAKFAAARVMQRQRFIAIRASDDTALERYAAAVDAALQRASLRSERLSDERLTEALQRGWSHADARKHVGPRVMHIESDAIGADGTWHATYAYQKWPASVPVDFLASLSDGESAIDVHQFIRKQDTAAVQKSLRDQLFKMETTKQTRQRKLAIKQVDGMLDALETNSEHVFEVAIYLQAHGKTRNEAVAAGRAIEKIVEESGAIAAPLRWEQADAQQLTAGVLEHRLLARSHRVDTSSVSRAYLWSASELGLKGGVPWGRSLYGKRVVMWSPWAKPMIPNPNVAIYATSGAGKGFSVKVLTSRMFFAGLATEMFAIDQAEEDQNGEYGRWATYCGGEVRKIRRDTYEHDMATVFVDVAAGRACPPVIAFNLAELNTEQRRRATVAFKRAIFKRAAKWRTRRVVIVDEMWSVIGDHEAESEVEDMVRRGRHLQIASFFMTQRPMDALSSSLGATVQSLCGTKFFGMQASSEISDVQKRLRWTDEQVEIISRIGVGQAMLEAGLTRIVFEVEHSPDEYQMANTDGMEDDAGPIEEYSAVDGTRDAAGGDPMARATAGVVGSDGDSGAYRLQEDSAARPALDLAAD